ncbi:MAG: Uma2 family endonuclease [Planctomycetota bacterium]
MTMLVADPELENRLRAERASRGADKYDEVWNGVYVMHAYPGDEHQELVNRFCRAMTEVIEDERLGRVRPGVNIASDPDAWTKDYRCPDVVVFLNDTASVCYDAFWSGGPDFAIEVISPGDESRTKLEFYAKVGTRELLLVDRDPWRLELYRHDGTGLPLAAEGDLSGASIESSVLPVSLKLEVGADRPQVVVTHGDSGKSWTV